MTARVFSTAFVLVVLLLDANLTHAQPAERCDRPWQIIDPADYGETSMHIRGRTPCRARMDVQGGPRVSQPPANGELVLESASMTYTPRAGFSGQDEFRITWRRVLSGGRSIQRTLRVVVYVTP